MVNKLLSKLLLLAMCEKLNSIESTESITIFSCFENETKNSLLKNLLILFNTCSNFGNEND